MRKTVVIIAIGSMVCALMSLAASPGVTQSSDPAPAPAPTTSPSIQGYADRDRTCLAWTDACRTCERGADGAVHCSNIGIACQPAAINCTSREKEPAKEPKK